MRICTEENSSKYNFIYHIAKEVVARAMRMEAEREIKILYENLNKIFRVEGERFSQSI